MGLKNLLVEAKYFYLQNSKAYCKEEVSLFSEGEGEELSYTINATLKPMSKESKVKIEVLMTLNSKFKVNNCKISRTNEKEKVTEKYQVNPDLNQLEYSLIKDGEKTHREFPLTVDFHIATPAISTLLFMTLKDPKQSSFKLYSSPNEWIFSDPPTLDELTIDQGEEKENFSQFELERVTNQTRKMHIENLDGSMSQITISEFFNMPLEMQFETVTIRATNFKSFLSSESEHSE
jgi:hypothetical protein